MKYKFLIIAVFLGSSFKERLATSDLEIQRGIVRSRWAQTMLLKLYNFISNAFADGINC
jgi:hypothetical protein